MRSCLIPLDKFRYAESDEIAPGGFTSFSTDLYDVDACPNAAFAASGYNF